MGSHLHIVHIYVAGYILIRQVMYANYKIDKFILQYLKKAVDIELKVCSIT